MILNNLDPKVAQFPQELVTYGGNGQVFSNWAQVCTYNILHQLLFCTHIQYYFIIYTLILYIIPYLVLAYPSLSDDNDGGNII